MRAPDGANSGNDDDSTFYLLSERLHGKKEDARLRGSDVDKLLVVAILIPEQDIDQLIS